MGTTTPPSDVRARITRALVEADIGGDVFFTSLGELGVFDVSVSGEIATVAVLLPIPSDDFRAVVERDVVECVEKVDGVATANCRFDPTAPDPNKRVDFIPEVKNVVAVASGKGGVGKSTVAVNIAAALANTGVTVGLLDADVYGPNAPTMLGLGDRSPDATFEDKMVPREAHGVKVMSMEFIVDEDDPIIWRGPLVDEFIKQLFDDVEWGALDYLIVDLPPGTGDAQLSLVQHLPVTGAVIVTTPQPVAVDDAHRGLRGFARYDVPVLGVVENMASFDCPDCGSEHDIFGTGGAMTLAAEFNVPVLGQLPIDSAIGALEEETDHTDPPGVSIPGLGRLQLPQTHQERERPGSLPPIAIQDEAGETRAATELLTMRTAARINQLVVKQERTDKDGVIQR